MHTIIIKIAPPHNVLKNLLTHVSIGKMFSLRCSDPPVNFTSRLPAEKPSHFPVNESHDLIIVDYAVGLGEVIVHETEIQVIVGVREEYVSFKRMDTAVGEDGWISDDVVSSLASISGLDSVQLLKDLSCLLFEAFLLFLL